MCEFLSVRQFAQSSATRHLQTSKYNSIAYKYYNYNFPFSIMGTTQSLPQTLLESFYVKTGEFDPQL